MSKKSGVLVIFSCLLLAVLFFADLAMAQMDPIYRFKGVNVPVKLKIKNKILEKGTYDLEFLGTSSPVLYFVRIMKGGKILDMFQGEEWPYASEIVPDVAHSAEAPQKPTLKMALNRSEKLLTLVFESGRTAAKHPLMRARFKLPYEE